MWEGFQTFAEHITSILVFKVSPFLMFMIRIKLLSLYKYEILVILWTKQTNIDLIFKNQKRAKFNATLIGLW
jgi:hypothetical protein